MIIRHDINNEVEEENQHIDRHVMTMNISDGAKVLYAYLVGLRTGANFNDKYILKAMIISQRALTNRKKELKDAGLILMEQITPRIYIIYIGHTRLSALDVKNQWIKEEDAHRGDKAKGT